MGDYVAIKLKYDDVVRLTKYLEEKCRQSPVYMEVDHTGVKVSFNVTNTLGEKLTITLHDEKYYANPTIIKSEPL
jgi:hypothetical protein